ncbi:hypothetical protein DFR69_115109 [Nocardia neocaledoniensis]|jgi:hypothetical protein|uniref:Uncharacterized protein n=1 Tax=Nocardia neocaledoniensis TaxID=236511 RepID=A0A317N492_9NOCA|nr:hypothetical protein DFR69_115109 [Nocardia neocaledoniensis]
MEILVLIALVIVVAVVVLVRKFRGTPPDEPESTGNPR